MPSPYHPSHLLPSRKTRKLHSYEHPIYRRQTKLQREIFKFELVIIKCSFSLRQQCRRNVGNRKARTQARIKSMRIKSTDCRWTLRRSLTRQRPCYGETPYENSSVAIFPLDKMLNCEEIRKISFDIFDYIRKNRGWNLPKF